MMSNDIIKDVLLKSGVFTMMSIDIIKGIFTGNGSVILCYILPGYRVLQIRENTVSLIQSHSIYTQISLLFLFRSPTYK